MREFESWTPVGAWIFEIVDTGDREGAVEDLFRRDATGGVGVVLVLQRQGRCDVRWPGDHLVIEARDMVLLDVSTPVLLRCSERSHQLCVALPRAVSSDLVRKRSPITLPGDCGIGLALQGLLLALHPIAAALPPSNQQALRTALGHLVLEAFGSPSGVAKATLSAPRTVLAALQATIEARLTDPGLRPGLVAAIHGISTRQLHRRFREGGTSFGAFVRERRLAHCCEDLIDPRCRRLPMTEIAFRWGFSDSAHFSRCFRAAFGCTAREFRAGLCSADERPTPASR